MLGESDGREGHQLCVPQDLDLELDELGDRREGQSSAVIGRCQSWPLPMVMAMPMLVFADADHDVCDYLQPHRNCQFFCKIASADVNIARLLVFSDLFQFLSKIYRRTVFSD